MNIFKAFTAAGTRDILKSRFMARLRELQKTDTHPKANAIIHMMSSHYRINKVPHSDAQLAFEALPFLCMEEAFCRDYLADYLLVRMPNQLANKAVNVTALQEAINESLLNPAKNDREAAEAVQLIEAEKEWAKLHLITYAAWIPWIRWLPESTLHHLGGESA